MSETLELSVYLREEPEVVYNAWLSSEAHTDFTGGKALIDPSVGGLYTAWDAYISGKTLVTQAPRRIVQSWRTTEFAESDPDSTLELLFSAEGEGTRLILRQSELPDGTGPAYTQGWEDFYFKPMREFFGG